MATATNHTIDEIINEINEDTSGWIGVMTTRGTTTFTAGNNIYEKVDVNKFDKELYEFIRDELFD